MILIQPLQCNSGRELSEGIARTTSDKSFFRGHLYRILTNPVCIGKIAHKGTVRNGLQDSIINHEVWDRAQALLADNAGSQTKKTKASSSLSY